MRTRRLIALLCGCAAAWALGPGGRLHGQELELIGMIPGPAAVVDVHGERAYLGAGRTLRIVDVADPAAPAVVGSVTLPENIYGIEVSGTVAYAAMDFGGLAESTPSSFSFPVSPWKLRGCALADPVLVAAADLRTEKTSAITADRRFAATASGRLNGVMIYFDLDLAPGVRLSTHPDRVDGTCHWAPRTWVLPDPLILKSGDPYRLTYHHGMKDQPNGVRVAPATSGAPTQTV